jgi:fatty-acid desaturase
MQKSEVAAVIAIILLMIAAHVGIYIGLWPLASFLSYIPQVLLTSIIGLFIWGFRKRIKSWLKNNNRTHYYSEKQK